MTAVRRSCLKRVVMRPCERIVGYTSHCLCSWLGGIILDVYMQSEIMCNKGKKNGEKLLEWESTGIGLIRRIRKIVKSDY